jgi:hypothetical protein
MNINLLFPLIYGLILGGGLSYFFKIHSVKTASAYSFSIFGTDSIQVIKYASVFSVAFLVGLLAVFSSLVQDLDYPRKYPFLFSGETMAAAFLPAFILLLMTYLRNKDFTKNTVTDFLLLASKFGLVHVLFQFSGVYSSVFAE